MLSDYLKSFRKTSSSSGAPTQLNLLSEGHDSIRRISNVVLHDENARFFVCFFLSVLLFRYKSEYGGAADPSLIKSTLLS